MSNKIKVSLYSEEPLCRQYTEYFDTFDDVKKYYGIWYNNIQYIYCVECDLDELPELPTSLHTLYCGWNNLSKLPELPSSLRYLYCNDNNFSWFPKLPEGLLSYNGGNNYYAVVKNLPSTLTSLSITNSVVWQIQDLSALESLSFLDVSGCGLGELPCLPNSLEMLICANNHLTHLTNLPSSLQTLYARNNQLIEVQFPDSIDTIDIYNNALWTLPPIPNSVEYLAFGKNPLTRPVRIYEAEVIVNHFHHLKYNTGMKILSYGNEQDSNSVQKITAWKKHAINELKRKESKLISRFSSPRKHKHNSGDSIRIRKAKKVANKKNRKIRLEIYQLRKEISEKEKYYDERIAFWKQKLAEFE